VRGLLAVRSGLRCARFDPNTHHSFPKIIPPMNLLPITKRCRAPRVVAMVFTLLVSPAFADVEPLYKLPAAPNPSGAVNLRQAIGLALSNHPSLATFTLDVRVAEARMIQAGLKPNPQLNFTAENLPGSGPYKDGELMEHTLQLSQLVELGGKRDARLREAEAGRTVAEWAYQVRRIEVLRDTAQAFVAVLASQKQVQLAEETAGLAAKATPMTQKRVEAGKANAVEVTRSNVAVASAKIELEQAKRSLASARTNLAALWGSRTANFDSVTGDFGSIKSIPAFSSLVAQIKSHPEITRWSAERAQREAMLAREHSLAKADVTVFGGPRTLGKAEEITFTLGFSIPLPFRNRNQGAIAAAEVEIAKTDTERLTSELNVFTQLSAAYQILQRAANEVEILNKDVLPGAAEAEKAVTEGYEAGRFTQLEILDARRTLIQARHQQLRALSDYHQAVAEIESLTAGPVNLPAPGAASSSSK
jgi:cobalt-zinc-cadmium efflux system outer membrane protein